MKINGTKSIPFSIKIFTFILSAILIIPFTTSHLTFAINADIEAGPLYSSSEADTTCPSTCSNYASDWTGQWTTTVPNAMSVCNCSILGPWTIDIEAGPIYSGSDANSICPNVSSPYGNWNGQWVTTVPNEMSVCGTSFTMDKLGWTAKGLATNRDYTLPNDNPKPAYRCPEPGNPEQLSGYINTWQCDDEYRDELNMLAADLNYVTTISKGTDISTLDGRYIYVLSKDTNQFYIRPYDRYNQKAPTATYCSTWYKAFTYPQNDRTYKGRNFYLHVRHSQLNNGWNPLWAAGEMQIWNGEVTVINNESGHFQPPAENVEYALNTLLAYNIPVSSSVKAGSFESNPAKLTESQCGTLLGKDDL
jgi:hypothetical protein